MQFPECFQNAKLSDFVSGMLFVQISTRINYILKYELESISNQWRTTLYRLMEDMGDIYGVGMPSDVCS